MFTDIVNSTGIRRAFVAEHGEVGGDDKYRKEVLGTHNERIRALLDSRAGFEVKTIGDSFLAAFSQPTNAVLCASEIQCALSDDPIPTPPGGEPLRVRIGLHTGQPTAVRTPVGWDYDGEAVNIAARIESKAGGGQVFCSGVTSELCGTLPGIRFIRCGPLNLKGLGGTQVVEILWRKDQQPSPASQRSSGSVEPDATLLRRVLMQPNPMRWWEVHQLFFIVTNALLAYIGWKVKEWTPGSWGLALFFLVVVCAAFSTSLRVDLLGTGVVSPKAVGSEVRRLAPWVRIVDLTFSSVLLVMGATIAATHPLLAAILVAMAVAGVISSLILEPAIVRSAFPDRA